MLRPMRSLILALAASALISCGGAEPTAEPPVTKAASAAPTTPALAASSSAPESGPAETAPPAVARVTIDTAAAIARLPTNAAVYGWFRPAAADTLLSWTKDPKRLARELSDALPGGSVRSLLADLGLEAGAPIAFSVTGPDRAPLEKIVKGLAGGKELAGVQRDLTKLPPNGVHVRLLATAAPGADVAAKMAATLSKMQAFTVERCPSAGQPAAPRPAAAKSLCGLAPEGTALVFASRHLGLATATIRGSQVEIDFVDADDSLEREAALLGARTKAPSGGPKDRCTKLDPEADLSLCADADQAAETGAASGMLMTLSAVGAAGDGLGADSRREIAKQGLAESMRNIELAKPKRVLLDDGTLSVTLNAGGFTAIGSWALSKNSKAGIEAQLTQARCAAPNEIMTVLFPLLVAGFGDRGADFTKIREREIHVREAGFGAVLVLFARTWPNFLGSLEGGGAPRLDQAPITKACLSQAGGRLEAKVTGGKLPVDAL